MSLNVKAMLKVVIGGVFIASMAFASADASLAVSHTPRPADIQVWLERADGHPGASAEYDVYSSVDEVVLNVRASTSCYAAIYVVDTAGYIHVVYPVSPYDNTYLLGNHLYRFYLGDFVAGGVFDRGVAYAFAVSSPFRFRFDHYGAGVFAGNLGFQIYGDPYVAARCFYTSIVPPTCGLTLIGVSHARFYLREYVRYPRYLCAGWHGASVAGRYSRSNSEVYKHYRAHAADPFRSLRPGGTPATDADGYARIIRAPEWRDDDVRVKTRTIANQSKPTAYQMRERDVVVRVTDGYDDVVKSTRDAFVKSKQDISARFQQLVAKKRDLAASSQVVAKADEKKVRAVTRTKQDVAHQKKASSRSSKTDAQSSKKASKTTKSTKERDGSR